MNKKIVGILVMTLLIMTAIPAVGNMNECSLLNVKLINSESKITENRVNGGSSTHSSFLWDNGEPDGRFRLMCYDKPSGPYDCLVADDFKLPYSTNVGKIKHKFLIESNNKFDIHSMKIYIFYDESNKPSYYPYLEYEQHSPHDNIIDTGETYDDMIIFEYTYDLNVYLGTEYYWLAIQPVIYADGQASYWLTSGGKDNFVYVDILPNHPRWTFCYDVWGEYYDVSFKIYKESNPPSAPYITGPSQGGSNKPQEFKFQSSDPDDDDVRYHIDWDDGTPIETTGYSPSGTQVDVIHTFTQSRSYTITAYAEDENCAESTETTKTIEITTPRTRTVYHPLFLQLFERFPNAFPILRLVIPM